MRLLFLLIILINIAAQSALARIDIVPQKILIDKRERSAELTVLNLLNAAGTFRIEIVNFRQDEKGVYQELQGPLNPAFDPADIVRLSPRQFRLEAGGRQKIRMSLRKPPNLPEGEYRFHVKAMRLAQEDERRDIPENQVSIMANVGVTIPVIVRHGQLSSSAQIGAVHYVPPTQTKNQRPALKIALERSGNASTLGALDILNAENDRIGYIKNMNIFTDIQQREVEVPLSQDIAGQTPLTIFYKDTTQKGHIFDEMQYQANP